MSYMNIVILSTNILLAVVAFILIHFLFFGFVGMFFKKTFPKTEEKLKYGLVIPARNEENVISELIKSIQKNNYPQDKLQIFVIAHNCTDNTAKIARELGATVYEYNNPEESTKGYAFKYLFSCIERDFGTKSFDGFFIFDADNILDKDYFSRMNDAFIYYDKKAVITSFRNSKNMGSNIISGLYGIYFIVGCRLECRGRTYLGCSTRVQGTGYLFNSDVVKDGWQYVTLTEDWEFTADQVLMSNDICFCDDAVLYDEQPTSLRIMWRQRLRWSRGHLIVCYTRAKKLIKNIFNKQKTNRGSIYDITANVLPAILFIFFLQILQFVLLMLAPHIDSGITYRDVFLGSTISFWSKGLLFRWMRTYIYFYAATIMSAIIIFIIERKRIKGLSFFKKVLIALVWPFFLFVQFILDFQAFFTLDAKWDPIPHNDKTSFEHVNQTENKITSAGNNN